MSDAIIEEDDTLAKLTLDVLRDRFAAEDSSGERAPGTHVSDLIFPRKAWLGKHTPAVKLSDDECIYFIAGRAHHEIIEALIAEGKMREVKLEWNDIHGTVDAVRETPVEIKTSRSGTDHDASEVPGHYILQLGMYCAMFVPEAKESIGTILILFLKVKKKSIFGGRQRQKPKLRSYTIRFQDLDHIRQVMLARKAMLEGDVAPPKDLCEPWLCGSCRFWHNECEGRDDAWA